jgi:hypothetical protein
MGTPSCPSTTSVSCRLSIPHPFITVIARSSRPSAQERDKGDFSCLTDWSVTVSHNFSLHLVSGYGSWAEHLLCLFSRGSGLVFSHLNTLYHYDHNGSFTWVIVGDAGSSFKRSPRSFHIPLVYHLSILPQCISIAARSFDSSCNIYLQLHDVL